MVILQKKFHSPRYSLYDNYYNAARFSHFIDSLRVLTFWQRFRFYDLTSIIAFFIVLKSLFCDRGTRTSF